MKKFFGITKNRYEFEIGDVTTFITILNVALVVSGVAWAPVLGLINCIVCLWLNVQGRAHINAYLVQFALIILNCYFLTL